MPCNRFCGHQVAAERFQSETEMLTSWKNQRTTKISRIYYRGIIHVSIVFLAIFSVVVEVFENHAACETSKKQTGETLE